MFKVFPASPQTFIDMPNCVLKDRVQYSMVNIPNVGDWNRLKYCIFARFLYCNCQVHRDFLIALYIYIYKGEGHPATGQGGPRGSR